LGSSLGAAAAFSLAALHRVVRELSAADRSEGRATRAVAWGSLGVGILSIFCNPFFIFSVIAIGNGVAALRAGDRGRLPAATAGLDAAGCADELNGHCFPEHPRRE
jgi:hypothetical protein